jgi:hypothetical protein
MQYFNGIVFHTVGDDVWQAPVQQFAGAFLTSLPSTQREFFQRTDGLADFNNGGYALDEARDLSGNRRCLASPLLRSASSGDALGVKHPLDARVHLFLFDKFPPVGLRDTFPHGSAKTGILFKQAHDSILYQALGICTGMAGDLG